MNSFIETQFPVSKLSKEAYKERKAGASQTLTGIGKWWGRKPLVLVRATLLGLLMPSTDDPKKDRDIFLKIMTMDEKGLRSRVKPNSALKFEAADSYDEKIAYCYRPEEIEGPSEKAWKEINAHLKTTATNINELVEELGKRALGHTPKVGDAFCGGGSIPFEAARLGCEAYASDLNPAACLLTWASLNIVGGGKSLQEEIKQAQEYIYSEVDKQISDLGIEHNEHNWRADAYLYCIEAVSPATGYRVPLAPSWVISEKYRVCGQLQFDKTTKRYRIKIIEDATKQQMQQAKSGTIVDHSLLCPETNHRYSISSIRGDRTEDRKAVYGLRMWENEDIIPREDDVFTERLYCIRYIEYGYTAKKHCTLGYADKTKVKIEKNTFINKEKAEAAKNFEEKLQKKFLKADIQRHYVEPTQKDLEREEKVIDILKENFSEWQEKGFIPSAEIVKGYNTEQPIRERGWTYWHHLFNPRQLLLIGLLSEENNRAISNRIIQVSSLLGIGRCADYNSKLCRWNAGASKGPGSTEQTFYNMALNTNYNYGTRGFKTIHGTFIGQHKPHSANKAKVLTHDARQNTENCDFWITDPPYADAVNYHELGDFFLSWYEKRIPELFPEWYSDSKKALAVKGAGQSFKQSMVECYTNFAKHMPDNGAQVVMFTHQDASVWADLAMILWASGLRVTAAWTIQTETDSVGIKKGNYVKGTVCMVLRKRISEEIAFPSDLQADIDFEVEEAIAEMNALEDNEDPNFSSTDFQLAAYVAALRVITGYAEIEGIDVAYELNKERDSKSKEKNPLEELIKKAVETACNYLIPVGMEKDLWRTLSNPERFYCKTLEMQAQGERRNGPFQELARGFGINEYKSFFSVAKSNEVVLYTPIKIKNKQLGNEGFGSSLLRNVLYAVRQTHIGEGPSAGFAELRDRVPDYLQHREKMMELLAYISLHGEAMGHWKDDVDAADLLKGYLENRQAHV